LASLTFSRGCIAVTAPEDKMADLVILTKAFSSSNVVTIAAP